MSLTFVSNDDDQLEDKINKCRVLSLSVGFNGGYSCQREV